MIKLLLRILQLVGVQPELRLGNLKLVTVAGRLRGILRRRGAGTGCGGQATDQRLVFLDELLQLCDSLRERKRIAREVAMPRLRDRASAVCQGRRSTRVFGLFP